MPRACQSAYAVLPLSRPHNDEAIRRAEAYIHRHNDEPLAVADLARDQNMSERTFMRRFKAATGRTPGGYLQATRITIARQMLESGSRSAQAVGEAVGYEDAAFFRALFRRETGLTPAEYRERFGGPRPALAKQEAARGS
jgi:transcriptional regulator GlxA family with amidase domain